MKHSIYIFLFLAILRLNAQDVQITASYIPSSLPMGSMGELSILVANISATATSIPVGGLQVSIDAPENYYNLLSAPTGTAASIFTWTPATTAGYWYGVNNAVIPAFTGGGELKFAVTPISTTPLPTGAATSINGTVSGDPNTTNNMPNPLLAVTTALPVTLSKFSARANDCEPVSLSWTTESEINNKGFRIEKAFSGKDFEELGFVESAHNSKTSNTYTFEDKSEENGTFYYRIVAVDFDGTLSICPTEAVVKKCEKDVALQIFPNPVSDKLNLFATTSNNQLVELSIYDEVQKLVRKIELNTNSKQVLNVKELNAGIYIISGELDGVMVTKRFIKIE